MTEYFDLYTADRRRLGRRIQRGAPIPHGEYHIVVQIMTVNSQGKILLTQRVPQKTSGGRWECSGGCAISGETSREAAVRELFEETSKTQREAKAIHDEIEEFYKASVDFAEVEKVLRRTAKRIGVTLPKK